MKQLAIFNRLFSSILCFILLLALPGITYASYSLSAQPTLQSYMAAGETLHRVSFGIKSTTQEYNLELLLRDTADQTIAQKRAISFGWDTMDQTFTFNGLFPSTTYGIEIGEYVGAVNGTGGTYRTLATFGSFTTPANPNAIPVGSTVPGPTTYGITSPQVNVAARSVSFILTGPGGASNLFVFIEASGNSQSIQKQAVTSGTISQSLEFSNLLPNTSYAVTLKRLTGTTYTSVQQLGSFKTSVATIATTTGTLTPEITSQVEGTVPSKTQCNDGIDNNNDGKADHFGVDSDGNGAIDIEPDPSCFSPNATEELNDDVAAGSLIPCTNKCTFSDVIRMLNTVLQFMIKVVLIPLFVIIIMYLGVRYIRAQGNPVQMGEIKKTFWNFAVGIIFILGAWLIVTTLLRAVGYREQSLFFVTQ